MKIEDALKKLKKLKKLYEGAKKINSEGEAAEQPQLFKDYSLNITYLWKRLKVQ